MPARGFSGPDPQIHLLSLLEVPEPVTFGFSAELTRAWQHISPQHKQNVAKADDAFERVKILISVTW